MTNKERDAYEMYKKHFPDEFARQEKVAQELFKDLPSLSITERIKLEIEKKEEV
jgi:hypothetical protein